MKERLIELLKSIPYNHEVVNYGNPLIADYLLANGVIVPPCKVGDKIYYLCGKKVFNLTVEKIVIKESGMFLVDKSFNDWYSIKELGKTLYLSEEEAEQSLVNYKSSKNDVERKEDEGNENSL